MDLVGQKELATALNTILRNTVRKNVSVLEQEKNTKCVYRFVKC